MTCPICRSETVRRYRPFCSKRCADLDLGRWITGAYAIPSGEPVEEAEDPADVDPDDPRRPH